MFKCPICGVKTHTLSRLKAHILKMHPEVFTECPVCKRKFRSVTIHCMRRAEKGDKEHLLWYYLTRRPTHSLGEVGEKAVKYAMEVLYEAD